jgi:hypothetical protein
MIRMDARSELARSADQEVRTYRPRAGHSDGLWPVLSGRPPPLFRRRMTGRLRRPDRPAPEMARTDGCRHRSESPATQSGTHVEEGTNVELRNCITAPPGSETWTAHRVLREREVHAP